MLTTDFKNSPQVKLGQIAKIQPGYLSRSQVKPASNGTHYLLQAKDVSFEGGVQMDTAICFNPERNPALYQISSGDILMIARGHDRRAFLIDQDLHNVLASNVFYIIRPKRNAVEPGFLAWSLNQPDTQAALQTGSHGTGIIYVARSVIEELSIALPPIEKQTQISKVIDLWQQQQILQAQINEKREMLIQSLCRQAIGRNKESNNV
jgi:restriction endonuclease S subunit